MISVLTFVGCMVIGIYCIRGGYNWISMGVDALMDLFKKDDSGK